jgi:ectoine hydroxylase-related dioxygenase (phytanoyl-CoA dioxygenase family)
MIGGHVMESCNIAVRRAGEAWYSEHSCTLAGLQARIACSTRAEDYPLAVRIASNVPVYACEALRRRTESEDGRRLVMAEWIEALHAGPGVIVLEGAFADTRIVDAASAVFERIIAEQRAAGTAGGDHFAKPGANDRIWNALEKLCVREPGIFATYYANDMIALVSEAWLGPFYQVTSQVNVVNPGGAAQVAHRDYHLGFQSPEIVRRTPAHVHCFSPMLTLQGAVAHCDMPLETGPTLYLPFSQGYGPGYLAAQDPGIRAWFEANCVQLPLRKGDAVFFNPALLHAAGNNRTADVRRMANLLQVSSAYGRAMESIDRTRMTRALFPALRRLSEERGLPPAALDWAIAACAEGYAFPTNLDRDPPIGGLAPESQQDLTRRALAESWSEEAFNAALLAQAARRLPHAAIEEDVR